MEKNISYGYIYDETNDVYKIWRNDGQSLEGYIPDGLFQQIALGVALNSGEMVMVCSVQRAKHFSADGTKAFIDLNERKFSADEIEKILNGDYVISINEESSKKQNRLQRVLSKFKKR